MKTLSIDFIGPAPLATGPLCEHCGEATRLVGIEAHPRLKSNDICTYECATCEEVVAVLSPPAAKSINGLVLFEPSAGESKIVMPQSLSQEAPQPAHGPACTKCKSTMRLVEIEPHPINPATDVRIFECVDCHATQALVVALA